MRRRDGVVEPSRVEWESRMGATEDTLYTYTYTYTYQSQRVGADGDRNFTRSHKNDTTKNIHRRSPDPACEPTSLTGGGQFPKHEARGRRRRGGLRSTPYLVRRLTLLPSVADERLLSLPAPPGSSASLGSFLVVTLSRSVARFLLSILESVLGVGKSFAKFFSK